MSDRADLQAGVFIVVERAFTDAVGLRRIGAGLPRITNHQNKWQPTGLGSSGVNLDTDLQFPDVDDRRRTGHDELWDLASHFVPGEGKEGVAIITCVRRAESIVTSHH